MAVSLQLHVMDISNLNSFGLKNTSLKNQKFKMVVKIFGFENLNLWQKLNIS